MPRQSRIGGSFAPPLTDELLGQYYETIDSLEPSAIKDALTTLYSCVDQWWGLPESKAKGRLHASGTGMVVDLEDDAKQSLDEYIPWDHELKAISQLLDTIEDTDLRNMAFHLLWHVNELNLDREPMTSDKL